MKQQTTDLDRLKAVRERLRGVLENPETSARDLATVSREYRLTLEAIDRLAPAEAGSALDEIAAKRKSRGA